MVAAPLILGWDLNISDQNKWGDLTWALNPNDVLVAVLKDIVLCLLRFRFMY